MSRAYRITIAESVRRHIVVRDGVATRLEILPVLAPAALGDLLAAELSRRGFARVDQGGEGGSVMVRSNGDGVTIEIAVAGDSAGTVTARIARDQPVEFAVSGSAETYEERAQADEAQLRRQLARDIDGRVAAARQRLAAQATGVLEGTLRDVAHELDEIGNQVTIQALKIRAGQLGEVREICEDPTTGSVTIKVRV